MPLPMPKEIEDETPSEAATCQVKEAARRQHNLDVIDYISALADEPFSRYWDNPKDAGYDDL